ncbi:acetate/propionate family kinase [Parenemella sanctibonifatiensis]|uniref:Acetate kinase n=1 Tax=Parenemella sanctibonifatiensis TaxID=2016505 RepID=A0A255EMA6_9ACTN|nr:acetate kinase [Parenemella sanctibonifatiensis]OYN92634.1 acetate kinase [Parenemella sanctibonifatiensis]
MSASVFVVNAGSSSLKYQLLDATSGQCYATGLVDRIGESRSTAKHQPTDGEKIVEDLHIRDHEKALQWVMDQFAKAGPDLDRAGLIGVGHRVVQGGARFDGPAVVTDDVISQIDELAPLAPLHNPANLLGIRAAQAAFPDLPHVAVFDTAFHLTIPPAAHLYAIDRQVAAANRIRKYGFHGTSHSFVSKRMATLLDRPLAEVNTIVLHLGNGASACAVRGGDSIETSMGMTPLAGLVMGTRSGDIDAGVIFHLHHQAGMSAAEIDQLLNKRSGMYGLTGTGDMRDVQAAADAGLAHATAALEVYAHRLRGVIGSYLVHLGRTDAIAFTAGVGENSPQVRADALRDLEGLGIVLDPARNEGGGPDGDAPERRISADESAIQVWVVPTNEELEIARQTRQATQA